MAAREKLLQNLQENENTAQKRPKIHWGEENRRKPKRPDLPITRFPIPKATSRSTWPNCDATFFYKGTFPLCAQESPPLENTSHTQTENYRITTLARQNKRLEHRSSTISRTGMANPCDGDRFRITDVSHLWCEWQWGPMCYEPCLTSKKGCVDVAIPRDCKNWKWPFRFERFEPVHVCELVCETMTGGTSLANQFRGSVQALNAIALALTCTLKWPSQQKISFQRRMTCAHMQWSSHTNNSKWSVGFTCTCSPKFSTRDKQL